MKRAGNIELLRFVFAIVIVLHHSMVEGLLAMTGGFLSVEFFYMITGAFMAKSCKKYIEENKQVEKIDITVKHTYKYLMKRIISILPELFISTIIGLVFFYNIGYINAQSYNFFRHVVNDFLFVQSLGMPVASVSGIVWYLSSMYFGIIIIYPIIRRHYTVYCRLIAPILALFLMGTIIHNYGTLNVPAEYLWGVFNTGNMRSIAMISLGCFAYELSSDIKEKQFGKGSLVFLTVLEVACYIIAIYHMHIYSGENSIFDEQAVFLLFVGIMLTLSEVSLIRNLLVDNKVAVALGKYSGALFFGHFIWVQHPAELVYLLKYSGNIPEKYVGILFALIVSIILMILSILIKKGRVYKTCLNKINNITCD
ncbi:acyltransferase family protein [Pseudobutyrivibrio sp.]|uniref:acyltransferase family protein n=1 Tax=Pseudobutyrivibrio sp. TaxID=2014367 RepID=UPI0025DCF8DB|nr:acyltransferase family protein [Pseudobutyrivibrio sp.]MBR5648278.1 hypothetical protein [Pseudobutyrivibrio sp.]